MMGLGRERRLNCRLYVDRRADASVVEKLDRLLVEKHFLNQTELIKHGIELVYREVYERENGKENAKNDAELSGADLRKLAEVIAGKLKPELRQLLEGYEARILKEVATVNAGAGGKVAECGDVAGAGEQVVDTTKTVRQADVGLEKNLNVDVPEEKVLSGQAISFLKGLNDD